MTVAALGIFIYAGIGLLSMFLGGEFLDYAELEKVLPVSREMARYHAMLGVEIGLVLPLPQSCSPFTQTCPRGPPGGRPLICVFGQAMFEDGSILNDLFLERLNYFILRFFF